MAFNPSEPRDRAGKWTKGGNTSTSGGTGKGPSRGAMAKASHSNMTPSVEHIKQRIPRDHVEAGKHIGKAVGKTVALAVVTDIASAVHPALGYGVLASEAAYEAAKSYYSGDKERSTTYVAPHIKFGKK